MGPRAAPGAARARWCLETYALYHGRGSPDASAGGSESAGGSSDSPQRMGAGRPLLLAKSRSPCSQHPPVTPRGVSTQTTPSDETSRMFA